MSTIRPSTFSIVGADPATGELGVAVQSRFLSVGAVVPWMIAGVGAIATQAWANTTYGPRGLELFQKGASPDDVVGELTASDENREDRQLGAVAADGRAATFTGSRCMDWASRSWSPVFGPASNSLEESTMRHSVKSS